MKRFKLHQRIRVTDAADPLHGRTGTVCRLLKRDASAWVAMDDDLPDNVRVFPRDDPRQRHTNLWPEQCEQITTTPENKETT